MTTVRDIEYPADGTLMVSRLALPEGETRRPAVLIAPEANGLDDHQRSRAERLAELGYVALAIDYHGGGRVYTDNEAMMARIGALSTDPDRLRALGRAGLHALLTESRVDGERVAAIGFCFGGTMMLELARSGADLKAVVGFHPGLGTVRPEDTRNITGKVLVCVGADDPFAPADQRLEFEAQMREAGVDWRMYLYGGAKHSFTHPNASAAGRPGLEYDEVTAARSWRAMLDLFDEVF
jgi:dienelactone hydrolase